MQEIAKISVNHNYPINIIIKLRSFFGEELPQFFNSTASPQELMVITNTLKTDSKKLKKIFASQKVKVKMASWPKDVLVAKRKPKVDLEATAEHRAGYYMLHLETWSKLAYHKLLELLMSPQAKKKVPATVTGWPLCQQVMPSESQNSTVNTRWPLCQQVAEAETQVPATITGWSLCQQAMPTEAKSQNLTVKKRQPFCQHDLLTKEKTQDPALTMTATMGQLVHQKAMCVESKTQDPEATMMHPLSKKEGSTKSNIYDRKSIVKSPCQENPVNKKQDPVATKRHMKMFSMNSLCTLKNMVDKTADVLDVQDPATPSYQSYLALLLKDVEKMEISKPIQPEDKGILSPDRISVTKKHKKTEGKIGELNWEMTMAHSVIPQEHKNKEPKPKWLMKAEILWILGFDFGARRVSFKSCRKELSSSTAIKIWLEYKRFMMKKLRMILQVYNIRKFAWSCMLDYQKWDNCLNFLKTNYNPRIPRFIGARVPTKPKKKPTPMHINLENYCMFYGDQGVSGMLPVLALAPSEGANVLDLCAAVGHHSILIGMLLQNTGMIVSNALSTDDLPQLWVNLHCFGVSCVIITHLLLYEFPQAMVGKFSHVLVDAPCSGTGVIKKHETWHLQINELEQVHLYTKLQQALLLRAIDSLTTGGHLVYSTSSVLVEENEAVVNYALHHRNIKLVHITLPFGEPGFINYRCYKFNMAMKECRRVYPCHNNGEVIFLAKIIKL
ncbi:28S rRNA (cytosine-C(5))-methyltransferase-like [Panulirus ornatus]|uniref:28S rRNA (cytosine-C(5))-methyltransferase-like n=1 Tax=Panulirus ornatus TaxID=150431 RepID=UPI003A872440